MASPSSLSLPHTNPPNSLHRAPSYTEEPLENEQRLALNGRPRVRPAGTFVKYSKHGRTRLKLTAQENGIAIPVYNSGESVEGTVELDDEKVEGVDRVEVKIAGRLKLNEIAEGGTSSANLALDSRLLWVKNPNSPQCPQRLDFALTLPATFTYDGAIYPLPPTYSVKLKGLPGFTASIEYSVSALVNRPSTVPPMVPLVKSKALGIHIGTTVVSTPLLYQLQTRLSDPLPPPLVWTPSQGFDSTLDWRIYETVSKAKKSQLQDVMVKFYLPRSRVFAFKKNIPFYMTFESSDVSLAAFMPFAPSNGSSTNKHMKIEVIRQATVDISNEVVTEARKDMWRVDSIGRGTFNLVANQKMVSAFSGELTVSDSVQVGGFKAGGLSVKDCIVLSMIPLYPGKCPFMDFRLAVPIRLVSSPWSADGTAAIGSIRQCGVVDHLSHCLTMASISTAQTTAAVQASSNTRQAGFAPSIPGSFDPPMLGERGLRQSDVGSYTGRGSADSTCEETAQSNDSGKKKIPFKEQVIGVAQKTRGTVMNKPELKEHGEKILQGETTHAQDK